MRSFADDREIQANSDRFLLSDFTYLSPNRAKISLKKISVLHHCNDIQPGDFPTMSLHCPRCRSLRIASANPAMKFGIIAGTLCGAARGASAALVASRVSLASPHVSPLSISLGSLSGAILGALAGAISGCTFGAQVGEQLDRYALANNICLTCGTRFNLPI